MDVPVWESHGKSDKLMKVETDALFSIALKYNQPNELAYSVSCSFINVILSNEHARPEGQLDPVPTHVTMWHTELRPMSNIPQRWRKKSSK